MTVENLDVLQQVNQLSLTETETVVVCDAFAKMNEQELLLDQIDASNVSEMVHVMPMTNVLREDVRRQPFAREDLLAGAPEHTDDSWQVPLLVK